ncbi:MAG: type II secretion system protein [Akkermansiaceae bacterium]|jgi:type II secretory pathway pseudopilin PulG|tara:strand:- start:3524 stop:3946 length:423 start_codon:yes stop_codon:yes gene_type:complete
MLTRNNNDVKPAVIRRGVTLIEMTVVIVMLMVLIGMSMLAVNGYKEWELASEATQKLRMVYNAQRTYLAEHPTESVDSLTDVKIIPYLTDDLIALPTAETLDGNTITVKVDVSPPVYVDEGGANYDPSGKTDDGLWDVGD